MPFETTRFRWQRVQKKSPSPSDRIFQGEQGCAALANLALDEANRSHIAQKEGVQAVPWDMMNECMDGFEGI